MGVPPASHILVHFGKLWKSMARNTRAEWKTRWRLEFVVKRVLILQKCGGNFHFKRILTSTHPRPTQPSRLQLDMFERIYDARLKECFLNI